MIRAKGKTLVVSSVDAQVYVFDLKGRMIRAKGKTLVVSSVDAHGVHLPSCAFIKQAVGPRG